MNGIFEHIIDEVRVGLYEIVKSREDLEVLSLLFVEQVKSDLILVELHLVDGLLQLSPLIVNHLFSLFDFFLLFLELLYFFVYLLLHHLEEILVLDLKLVHDSPEALFELIHLFVELLSYLHLELVVQLFVDGDTLVVLFYLQNHLFDHFFHFLDLRRNLDHIMLHFGVLEDTLGAEHRSVIFAVELYLLGRMDVAIPDGGNDFIWVVDISLARTVVHTHWQSGHYRIIYG